MNNKNKIKKIRILTLIFIFVILSGIGIIYKNIDKNVNLCKESFNNKDFSTALKACKKASKYTKDSRVFENLGDLYFSSSKMPLDIEEGLKWWHKSAELGSVRAQSYLSNLYFYGDNKVEVDYVEAAKWAEKAAEQGKPNAQAMIGELYGGFGNPVLEQDFIKAYKWLYLADTIKSKNLLEAVSVKLTAEQIEQATALAEEWKAAHLQKQE